MNLIDQIASEIEGTHQNNDQYVTVYQCQEPFKGKNTFLFFIKPEITQIVHKPAFRMVLELVIQRIHDFDLSIMDIRVLSASYLEKYDIMAKHYGIINKIARRGKSAISDSARERFKEVFGNTIDECQVLGAFEFLESYPIFNPISLDHLWQNGETTKLSSGTYCERLKLGNQTLYLLNGFHPRQLLHYTAHGRSIVVMTLCGDLKWKEARSNFIGATNPLAAQSGSLRREIYEKKDELGLEEISQRVNGFHLSAGPVEGLAELMRFNSNFSTTGEEVDFKEYPFGQLLHSAFSEKEIGEILNNMLVAVGTRKVSTYDLTEEQDSDRALRILQVHLNDS